MQLNANVTERTTDWRSVEWRKAYRTVRNLRQRIFRASSLGNYKKVRNLQRLLLKSYANILISVRKVTQVNKGRYTPGVDKLVVKTPEARGYLVDILGHFIPWKPLPVRKTYIPKKGSNKKRPLGIPSIVDRCLQAIVKNALEPSWEPQFESTSYGFRPGRAPLDAVEKVFDIARPRYNKSWALKVDIKGFFDNISHEFVMKAVGNFPARKLIQQWLKAGYMEDGAFYDTEAGTPQGGIVSPLIANIALHGMEEVLGVKYNKKNNPIGSIRIVRYADDFVVFSETKEEAENALAILTEWLKQRGLTISQEKTKIVHLSEGLDFLGFHVRLYKTSNSKSGWKLLIKPSAEFMKEKRSKLKDIWLENKSQCVEKLIKVLNPVIRGIANYLRSQVSSEAFSKLDDYMFQRETRYAKRMHPKKSNKWRSKRYWGKMNLDRDDKWVFGNKRTGIHLLKFSWFNIKRHNGVRFKASPDDPNMREYWEERRKKKSTELIPSHQVIAKKQDFKCPICGQTLFNDEELHVHHITPRKKGGSSKYSNLQLVHFYCHQQVHSPLKEKADTQLVAV